MPERLTGNYMSNKWESSLALINIHCDQNIDMDIVVDQFAGKPADTIIMLTDLLTELDMRLMGKNIAL